MIFRCDFYGGPEGQQRGVGVQVRRVQNKQGQGAAAEHHPRLRHPACATRRQLQDIEKG